MEILRQQNNIWAKLIKQTISWITKTLCKLQNLVWVWQHWNILANRCLLKFWYDHRMGNSTLIDHIKPNNEQFIVREAKVGNFIVTSKQ